MFPPGSAPLWTPLVRWGRLVLDQIGQISLVERLIEFVFLRARLATGHDVDRILYKLEVIDRGGAHIHIPE